MADCYRYLVIFAWLILLKFSVSLPFMGTIAAWIEKYLEVQVDLDFKFRGRFFDWTDVPEMATALTADRGRLAFRGKEAPNPKLNFVDRSYCHLFNFVRPYRPLVVNFISRVDEPFWTQLKAFNDLARRMSWMVDFLTVVIGCGVVGSRGDWGHMLNTERTSCLRHHFCLHDRKTVASFLVDAGIAGDLVYDTPSNDAERQYAAMPERLYVIYKKIVVYDSGRGGDHGGYRVEELRGFLWKLYHKVQKEKARLRSREDRERMKRRTSPPQFSSDDPRHPDNVKKLPLTKKGLKQENKEGSGSGESGLSVNVSEDASALLKSPGPGILKKQEISSESMDVLDIVSAVAAENLPETNSDESTTDAAEHSSN